jgi:hypothetical protein
MPIAKTGDVVYWKDGKRTSFTLLGDLQTARFPNTDEATSENGQKVPGFFDWFGINWATPPADGKPGVRQSLIIDAETIGNVTSLLKLMRDGVDMNGNPAPGPHNEWGVPSGPITSLMAHAAAATRFPNGWAGSGERRKYMFGSVPSDLPRPRPQEPAPQPPTPQVPTPQTPDPRDQTIKELRAALEQANSDTEAIRTKLADAIAAREKAEKVPAAVRVEVQKARSVLGKKPAGRWWQAFAERIDAISKVVG